MGQSSPRPHRTVRPTWRKSAAIAELSEDGGSRSSHNGEADPFAGSQGGPPGQGALVVGWLAGWPAARPLACQPAAGPAYRGSLVSC